MKHRALTFSGQLAALVPAVERAALELNATEAERLRGAEKSAQPQRPSCTSERAKRERAVLDYLAAHQPAMRSVIARHVGCRPDTLTHTLRALRDRGLARSVGHLRGARWVLPNWEGV